MRLNAYAVFAGLTVKRLYTAYQRVFLVDERVNGTFVGHDIEVRADVLELLSKLVYALRNIIALHVRKQRSLFPEFCKQFHSNRYPPKNKYTAAPQTIHAVQSAVSAAGTAQRVFLHFTAEKYTAAV